MNFVDFAPKFFVGRGTKVDANGPEDNWENEDVAIDLAVLVNGIDLTKVAIRKKLKVILYNEFSLMQGHISLELNWYLIIVVLYLKQIKVMHRQVI